MDERAQYLVQGLRRADAAAFEEVYRTYRSRIYSFLVRLSRDPSLSEELLQETWLRLARAAPDLSEETQLGAWLFSVARNLFINHTRWNQIRLATAFVVRRTLDREPPTPFDLAQVSETERRLEEALGALSSRYREILLLVCVEGFAPIDAARILGISPDSARQRLARARAALAEEIGVGVNPGGPDD